ncbi:MAG: phosphodiester glycosidase family protein [Flavobacteriales bacterium]|nr:phosphodiester glycosidase family protein [Flavobacteriales bacterium]
MSVVKTPWLFLLIPILLVGLISADQTDSPYEVDENKFFIHTSDPATGNLKMILRNDTGAHIGSLKNTIKFEDLKGNTVSFAMNGGMYMENQDPLGLYIEDGKQYRKLNKVKDAYGNFYLQPNGVFYIRKDNTAGITETSKVNDVSQMKYATQSGPMLLIDGKYHPKLNKGSSNLRVRNGVGILPNGEVMFAISKKPVNFYDFATLFKQNGCEQALYLDGFVSRMYAPKSGVKQQGGRFGVIIVESSPKQ